MRTLAAVPLSTMSLGVCALAQTVSDLCALALTRVEIDSSNRSGRLGVRSLDNTANTYNLHTHAL